METKKINENTSKLLDLVTQHPNLIFVDPKKYADIKNVCTFGIAGKGKKRRSIFEQEKES